MHVHRMGEKGRYIVKRDIRVRERQWGIHVRVNRIMRET